jgi:hypothetical protein
MKLSLKNKIVQRLNKMDDEVLQKTWLIINEISSQNKIPAIVNKSRLEQKLSTGMKQLDNGEGTNMKSFITGMKKKYGSR